MKGHIHSRIAKLLVVLALAVVASVMFVFVGCSSECEHEKTHTETVAATCTTAGSEKTVCDDCGETIKTETIDALGHKWDEGKVVAATCAAGGYTLKTCTVCGDQQQTDLTEALPHAWKDTTTVAATCTTAGYTVQTCEACGATRDTNIVAAKGHDWEDKEVAATCGTAGRTYQECSVCHEIRNQVTIPATGEHNWEKGETVAATCETNGYTEYECSVCHATKQDDIKQATDHDYDYDNVLTQKPTCTQRGYYYTICSKCGTRENLDSIPATGHSLNASATTTDIDLPDCTTDGSISGVCAGCGEEIAYTADEIAAGAPVTNLPASNTEDAEYYPAEAFTGETVTEANRAKYFLQTLGHDYAYANTYVCQPAVNGQGQQVTDEDGNVLWNHCDRCDEDFLKVDHTYGEGFYPCMEAIDPVTKLPLGYAYICEVCDEEIDVVDHSEGFELMTIADGEINNAKDPVVWAATAEGTAASCQNYYVCKWCAEAAADGVKVTWADGTNYKSNPHRPNATAPTCEEAVYCLDCGRIFEAALGHEMTAKGTFGDFAANVVNQAKDCTHGTITYYHCGRCGDLEEDGEDITWTEGVNYFIDEADDQEAHTYREQTIYDPASDAIGCARNGWKIETCINKACGHSVRIELKPTVYTKNADGTMVAVTGELDPTGAPGYWWNSTTPFTTEDLANYIAGKNPDGDEYTDAEGRYGFFDGGQHNWKFVVLDYENDRTLTDFVPPLCHEDGTAYYECSECGIGMWRDIDLNTYIKEMSLEKAEVLAQQKYHSATMFACGHDKCPECDPTGTHNAQYPIRFVVRNNAFTVADYAYYSCQDQAVNMANVQAYLNAIVEKYEETGVYSVKFYTDNTYKTEFTVSVVTLPEYFTVDNIGDLEGVEIGDRYNQPITIYVERAMLDASDNDNLYFNSGFNANPNWYGEAGSRVLDVEFYFNNNVIDYTTIDRVAVYITNGEFGAQGTTTLASAVSEDAVLTNLWEASYEWGLGWDQNDDGELDNPEKLWVSVGEFAKDLSVRTNSDQTWVFTYNDGFTNGMDLTGNYITIQITVGRTVYTSTQVVASCVVRN